MPEPRVGVVIPAWNAEPFLAQALASVLAQTYRPCDVVVVDDGSTDASASVAAAHGPPVRVLTQPNAGIGASRNRGVEAVDGDFIAFLDADDLLTAESIACRMSALAKQPEAEVLFGGVRRFSELHEGAPLALNELQAGHLPGAMIVRRTTVERVGKFPVHARVTEGLDWLLRAREIGVAETTVPEQVMWRRVHGLNNSLRHRAQIGEFAHALKASLDRRRAVEAGGAS